MIEIEPELELFLGIGLVRNDEYIGLYFNLTAWNITTQGTVQQRLILLTSELIEHIKGIFNIEGQNRDYEQTNIIRISLRKNFRIKKSYIFIK